MSLPQKWELKTSEYVINRHYERYSKEECMLCPITSEDVLPDYPLQYVTYFDMKE